MIPPPTSPAHSNLLNVNALGQGTNNDSTTPSPDPGPRPHHLDGSHYGENWFNGENDTHIATPISADDKIFFAMCQTYPYATKCWGDNPDTNTKPSLPRALSAPERTKSQIITELRQLSLSYKSGADDPFKENSLESKSNSEKPLEDSLQLLLKTYPRSQIQQALDQLNSPKL